MRNEYEFDKAIELIESAIDQSYDWGIDNEHQRLFYGICQGTCDNINNDRELISVNEDCYNEFTFIYRKPKSTSNGMSRYISITIRDNSEIRLTSSDTYYWDNPPATDMWRVHIVFKDRRVLKIALWKWNSRTDNQFLSSNVDVSFGYNINK